MNLKVVKLPPIQDSTKSTNDVDIDGRDGNLTEFNKYTSDIKQVECDLRGSQIDKVVKWLRGSGPVIFGNRPDRYYNAEIVNVVPLEQIIENQLYNFPIQFKCQPFGYLLNGKDKRSITNGIQLFHNKADIISLPIITIYGSGSCTFNINGRVFTISEIGTSITIDSTIKMCYDGKEDKINGPYPYLEPDVNNTITWSGTGVTKVEITPNWRCI
jgi:phage-related protein